MTERERLIELISEAKDIYPTIPLVNGCKPEFKYFLADYLLANGVTAYTVKAGDSVYYPVKGTDVIYETKVYGVGVDCYGDFAINPKEYPNDAIAMYGVEVGKTVFRSREEAEKALAERSKE